MFVEDAILRLLSLSYVKQIVNIVPYERSVNGHNDGVDEREVFS
jgi:hypothetical protein